MTIFAHLSYLDKHRFVERQIQSPPSPQLGIVVVIPCHDEPHLLQTLDSLETCESPKSAVEVIVVVNAGVHHSLEIQEQNTHTFSTAQEWSEASQRQFSYHFLHFPQLPKKHAGVGLARKIGMDEAVDRLEQVDRPKGVILCLDADSQVESNYLVEVERFFTQHPKTEACSLHFEHPTSGSEFETSVYEGIVQYELFLRFYIEALRWAGYPHAYQTIGSSMAVRSSAYQKRGGMNRRKAGEDFYFLHKFIQEGTLGELNTTKVIPSPRPSHRVPFGTGRSIQQWLESDLQPYQAYAWETFEELQQFLAVVPDFYHNSPPLPSVLSEFLAEENWEKKLEELRQHVSSQKGFVKRFYKWFDGLKVLKWVHYARDHAYPEIPLIQALQELFDARGQSHPDSDALQGWLTVLRSNN